jgi:hypothetical protein
MMDARTNTRITVGQGMANSYRTTPLAMTAPVREMPRRPAEVRAPAGVACKPNGDPNSLVLWGSEDE